MTLKLYDFQIEDKDRIKRIYNNNALLAWAPGLGKGVTALSIIKDDIRGPVIIVCPAYLKEHWRREADKHIGRRVEVLSGLTPTTRALPRGNHIFVCNYDILRPVNRTRQTWTELIVDLQPDMVVFDESHLVKELRAKRSRAAKEISRASKHVLCLTGTPTPSRPIEIWHQLHLVNPDLFPSRLMFGQRYCNGYYGRFGWDFSGASNLPELFKILTSRDGCMVRRRKEDVIKDLPVRTRDVIPFDLPSKARLEYDQAVQDFIDWLKSRDPRKAARAMSAEQITKIGYIKRLAAELKYPQVRNWVSEFLDGTDEKLLVFGLHKSIMIHPLFDEFEREAVLVTGDVDRTLRQAAFDRFNQDPKCRLLIGNMQAAGMGWSCTSANNYAFVEESWVPGDHEQAGDRVQGLFRGTGMPVNEYWLVANDTIDIDLFSILQNKIDNSAQAIDGKPLTQSELFGALTQALIRQNKKAPKRKRSRR